MENNTKPENPAAFPRRVENNWGNTETSGMSLIDYFAAKAMQALVSAYASSYSSKEISFKAYVIANAMLIEREREKQQQ